MKTCSEDFNWFFGWYDSGDARHRIGIEISQSPNQQNGLFRGDFGLSFTPGGNVFADASLDGTTSITNGNQDIPSGTYQFNFNYIPGFIGDFNNIPGDMNYSIGPYHFDFSPTPQTSQDFSVFDSFGFVQQTTSVIDASITFNAVVQNITYTGGTALVDGDVNGDTIVNGQDIALIASHWLSTGPGLPGDANGDGIVNGQDIALTASHFLQTSGRGPGTGASVPEPSTFVLFALGSFVLVAQRNRRRARAA